jgi:hypothetical protein
LSSGPTITLAAAGSHLESSAGTNATDAPTDIAHVVWLIRLVISVGFADSLNLHDRARLVCGQRR